MNRAELIDELAARFEGNKRAAGHALDSVLDTITRTVAQGEKVALAGFGVFERAQRAARMARNPATGEPVQVRATAVPRFKPSQALKEIVSGARKLPRLVVKPPPAVRPTEAAPAKRAAAARPAVKKTATARPAAKRAAAARPAGKKTTARKAAAKKAPARKAAAKKTTARKTTARKTTARKTTARKTTARKTTARKTTARKTTARKTAAKRTTTRKAAPRKTAAARGTKRTAKKTTSRR